MREEKNFDENQGDTENKKRDYFPAGQASEIVAEKEKRETDCRNDPGQRRARNFEFEPGANDSAEQEHRRERGDPKREPLKPGWMKRYHAAFEVRFFFKIDNRIGNAVREQRFAIDLLGRFLRVQRQ